MKIKNVNKKSFLAESARCIACNGERHHRRQLIINWRNLLVTLATTKAIIMIEAWRNASMSKTCKVNCLDQVLQSVELFLGLRRERIRRSRSESKSSDWSRLECGSATLRLHPWSLVISFHSMCTYCTCAWAENIFTSLREHCDKVGGVKALVSIRSTYIFSLPWRDIFVSTLRVPVAISS